MLDADQTVVSTLQANVARLGLVQVEVSRADALTWLAGAAQAFDVVFLDPPFGKDLLGSCCERLQSGGWLAAGARVYLEAHAGDRWPEFPRG